MKLTNEMRSYLKAMASKVGKARKKSLSPERRSEIARNAVNAREAYLKAKNGPH